MCARLALRVSVFLAFLLLILYGAPILQSCSEGPTVFSDFSLHPDVPLDKFAAGNLGVVQPSFARSYLVVAYRYASGVPLTKDEQLAAFALWERRVPDDISSYEASANTRDSEEQLKNPYRFRQYDATETWRNARSQVLSSDAPHVNQLQGGSNYADYVNCADDALDNAAFVLGERRKTFGKDHPGVKAWAEAQDLVFANCGGTPDKPAIPAPADSTLPEVLRFDREYQIAAAYMYSQHFDDADAAFQRIASEKNSPWREIAPYLVARNMVRRATLEASASDHVFDPEKTEKAASYIRATLAASPNNRYAVPLQALLDRAEFHLHSDQQCFHLSELLRRPAPEGRFYHWLWDYTWLLDQRRDTKPDYPSPASAKEFDEKTAERQKDDLTDWIATFQIPAETDHALQMWRAHHDSLPWLLAVLSKTEANSSFASEVLAAADRVPASSPAYITAFYHRMRLRNAAHNYKEVRQSIDTLLASPADLPSVAKDFFLDLRLDAAGDLNDALRFLPRTTCSESLRDAPANCPGTMPEHPARYLDALPLDVLVEVLHNKDLPDEEKSKFVRNIWMRAVLLGRHDVAQSLDAAAFNLRPDQLPVAADMFEKLVKDYEAATPDEKQFAAIFLLQHQFGFGYETGSTYAWCASPRAFKDEQNSPQRNYYWGAGGSQTPAELLEPAAFLTEAQHKQAQAEQTALEQADSQANYYTKVVFDFAEKHPDDPRVPEALSRAVKNTRMNCNNERTSPLSKKAFDLLHHRYASTSWAKNTKYWY